MKKIIFYILIVIYVTLCLDKIVYSKTTLSGFSRIELRSIYLTKNPLSSSIRSLWTGVDTSSREPHLMIQVHSEPAWNTSFNVQFGFNTAMDGNRTTTLFLPNEFIASGKWITEFGDYQFFIGGPFWTLKNSPLTFGSSISGGRRIYFERYPWDEVKPSEAEYKNIVENFDWMGGATSADRLGARGVKGLKFEGFKIPGEFELLFFYGVNDQYYNTYSKLMFGNLRRQIGMGKMGLNFSYHSLNPNYKLNPVEVNELYSVSYDFNIFGFSTFSEIGFSKSILNSENEKKYGVAFYIDINKFFINQLPLKITFYYVHPTYKGIDTSVTPTYKVLSTDSYLLENIISEEGVLYNNRLGSIFKSGYKFQNILFNFSLGLARTIEKTENKIIFPHHLNHFCWFYLYNGRDTEYNGDLKAGYDVDYEGAYENATIPGSDYSYKYFNLFASGLNINLFQRTFLITKFQFNDINSKLLLPPFNSDILRIFYHDLFLAYGITPKFFIIGFYGYEFFKSISNIYQKEYAFGFGFNFEIQQRTAIYFRTRKFIHRDLIRVNNDFDGWWTSLECKTYF